MMLPELLIDIEHDLDLPGKNGDSPFMKFRDSRRVSVWEWNIFETILVKSDLNE